MRRLILLALLITPCATALADGFQPSGKQFVLREGDRFVRFDRGRWSAGIEGGKSVTWHVFLWHDKWIYETLDAGPVDAPARVEPDGSLTVRGQFSTRGGAPAVKYALHAVPKGGAVQVRCELEKSGPLVLPNGAWLRLSGAQGLFDGQEQVWVDPTWSGKIAAPCQAIGRRLLIALDGRRSLSITRPRLGEINSEGSTRNYAWRVNLLARDFDVGKRVAIDYEIGFDQMPDRFAGQILPSQAALAIVGVTPNLKQVPRYGKLELAVDCRATYENPYDPDQVTLDATFTAPSGREIRVPGFFMVDQQRQVSEGCEVMIPQGQGAWRIRFAPAETGVYRWRLQLRDRSGKIDGGPGSFEAVASRSPGFVRRSKVDPHYFAFDSGQGYFAIGHNLPIYHTTEQLGDEAMRKYAAAGENFNRWWMSSTGFGLEWMDRLGWYRQDAAARIDRVVELAEPLKLYYMLCMDTHQDFRETGWHGNPFNALRGGPCREPADWFTDPQARQLYKKRLRYTVARWGYSPHILCWEFGNEMEGWPKASDEVKLVWHREMSDHLRAIDPFGHLITTSFWSNVGPEEFWRLPNIDIAQTHCYTNDDANVADPVRRYSLHQWEKFPKPHVFGEFGIRSHDSTADKDPQGWAVHNALWAGLFSFCAGGPMPWWHESYIDKLDLYFHFTALARFAEKLPLGTQRMESLETATPEYRDRSRPPELRDAVVAPLSTWGKPEHNEFVIQPDGTVADDRRPLQLLHGRGHPDLINPPTFVVTYPKPGRFTVRVGRVSRSGLLRITIDNQPPFERELPCGPNLGRESTYRPQWKLWETTYDESIAVDVPAGRHRIRVENLGGDWVTVSGYTFQGCQVLDRPNVRVCGMRTAGLWLLWVQNRDSCWYNRGQAKVADVAPFGLQIPCLTAGRYRVEWWETWRGKCEKTEHLAAGPQGLRLDFPALASDVALKITAE
jgi:hypothetical protein